MKTLVCQTFEFTRDLIGLVNRLKLKPEDIQSITSCNSHYPNASDWTIFYWVETNEKTDK